MPENMPGGLPGSPSGVNSLSSVKTRGCRTAVKQGKAAARNHRGNIGEDLFEDAAHDRW
jgi:hypothetical protein